MAQLLRLRVICDPQPFFFRQGGFRGCPTTFRRAIVVILSGAKNLIVPVLYLGDSSAEALE